MSDKPHALLIAARANRPSADDRARIHEALMERIAASPPADLAEANAITKATTSPPGATTFTSAVAGKTAKLTALALVAGGGWAVGTWSANEVASRDLGRSVASESPVVARASGLSRSIVAHAHPTNAVVTAPPKPARAPAPAVSVQPARDDLARDLETLRRADAVLRTGDPSGAMAMLGSIRARALGEEVQALTVLARCALSHPDARARAASFVDHHPHSTYVERIGRECTRSTESR